MPGGVMVGGKGSSLTLATIKIEPTKFIFQVCTQKLLLYACQSRN